MSYPSHDHLPGRAFERRVVEIYQAFGYQVTSDVQMPGKQTDLLVKQAVQGAPPRTLAIECKDTKDRVGNIDALAFVARVVTHRAAGLIDGGVLVSSRGFTADARATAEGHPYVSLLTWDELASQLIDVRQALRDHVI